MNPLSTTPEFSRGETGFEWVEVSADGSNTWYEAVQGDAVARNGWTG